MNYLPSGNCELLMASNSATLRQPAPSPVLHLLWLRTPLPNLPVRAPAADAFTEEPLTTSLLVLRTAHTELLLRELRYCSRRPLITTGHPVRSSVPSPSRNNPGFGTPPPHRPANYVYYCPAVRLCRALLISATRETITTPPPNVYPGHHRFWCARQRDSRPRPQKGHADEYLAAVDDDGVRNDHRLRSGLLHPRVDVKQLPVRHLGGRHPQRRRPARQPPAAAEANRTAPARAAAPYR